MWIQCIVHDTINNNKYEKLLDQKSVKYVDNAVHPNKILFCSQTVEIVHFMSSVEQKVIDSDR